MARLTADPCPAYFGPGRAISALPLVEAVSFAFCIPMIIKSAQEDLPVRVGPPEEEFVPGSAAAVLIIDCKGRLGHMTYGGTTSTEIWDTPRAEDVGPKADFARRLCGMRSQEGGDDRDGEGGSDMEVGATTAVLRTPVADLRAKPWYELTYTNQLGRS